MKRYYVVGNRQRKTFVTGPMLIHEALRFIEDSDCGYEAIPVSCNNPLSHEWKIFWNHKEIEKIHCESCNRDYGIPIELFYESEQIPCPYCGENERIYDVETVVVVEPEIEVKAS